MAELDLKVTEARINDVDLETFYNLDTNPKAPIDFVAHFAVDEEGRYLPKADAIKLVLKGRKLGDIKELSEQLQQAIEDAAVPKG